MDYYFFLSLKVATVGQKHGLNKPDVSGSFSLIFFSGVACADVTLAS